MKRTMLGVADRVTESLFSRRQRTRLARHLLNRASGDNEPDMERNGERALVDRLQRLMAGQAVTVLDVGANVGEWSALLSAGLASGSAVYAFEPVATTHARLCENLAGLRRAARLVPVHAALGETDGELEIFVYGGELSGANSLHERDARALGTVCVARQAVRCHRGDSFCREQGIDRIAFVKLDVEGHELSVLRGFASALEQSRIGAVQFEYGGTWIDARVYLKDAFAFLLERGYRVGKLFPDAIEWHDHYDYQLESFQYANFVAALPEWQRELRTLA